MTHMSRVVWGEDGFAAQVAWADLRSAIPEWHWKKWALYCPVLQCTSFSNSLDWSCYKYRCFKCHQTMTWVPACVRRGLCISLRFWLSIWNHFERTDYDELEKNLQLQFDWARFAEGHLQQRFRRLPQKQSLKYGQAKTFKAEKLVNGIASPTPPKLIALQAHKVSPKMRMVQGSNWPGGWSLTMIVKISLPWVWPTWPNLKQKIQLRVTAVGMCLWTCCLVCSCVFSWGIPGAWGSYPGSVQEWNKSC